jgi:hypothetical protein
MGVEQAFDDFQEIVNADKANVDLARTRRDIFKKAFGKVGVARERVQSEAQVGDAAGDDCLGPGGPYLLIGVWLSGEFGRHDLAVVDRSDGVPVAGQVPAEKRR